MDRFLTDSIHEESGNPSCTEACPIDQTGQMQVEAEVQSYISIIRYIADCSFKLDGHGSTTGLWDKIFSSFSPPSYLNDSLPMASLSAYSLPPASPNSDSSDYQPTSPLFLSPTLRRSTQSQPVVIAHPLGTEEATSITLPSGFVSLRSLGRVN
jgi:hypothetical protein